MLAVFAPVEVVRDVLKENALELVIANKNAPRQCVVSGAATEIERSGPFFAARQIATQPLDVSRAFHSRLVSGAEAAFGKVLESIAFSPSTIPVFSNTTAPTLSGGVWLGPRDPRRPARPSRRIRRPDRSDVPDGSEDVSRGWSGIEAQLAGSRDPRRDRTTRRSPSTLRVALPATSMTSPARSPRSRRRAIAVDLRDGTATGGPHPPNGLV